MTTVRGGGKGPVEIAVLGTGGAPLAGLDDGLLNVRILERARAV
jgi:hypothetical protein